MHSIFKYKFYYNLNGAMNRSYCSDKRYIHFLHIGTFITTSKQNCALQSKLVCPDVKGRYSFVLPSDRRAYDKMPLLEK